jgi:hypothetical protein
MTAKMKDGYLYLCIHDIACRAVLIQSPQQSTHTIRDVLKQCRAKKMGGSPVFYGLLPEQWERLLQLNIPFDPHHFYPDGRIDHKALLVDEVHLRYNLSSTTDTKTLENVAFLQVAVENLQTRVAQLEGQEACS